MRVGILLSIALGLTLPTVTLSPAAAEPQEKSILVLDASGSMWGQIDGVNKITIARQVVQDLLKTFPSNQELGLTVYGHREKGNCADIETLVKPGLLSRDAIAKAVAGINPRGMTPMADAVTQAAKSMRHTEIRATVILVSDGIETCNPDPCGAAKVLEETGVDFTAHVVGFDVNDPEALKQMQCIAGSTGGLFLSASNAVELTTALATVAEKAAEPSVAQATYEVAFRATLGEGGEDISSAIEWSITSGDGSTSQQVSGGDPRGPFANGAYRAMAKDQNGAEVIVDFVVAGQARTVIAIFPVPVPKVEIIAPNTAPAGSQIEVGWVGPSEKGDNIQIGRPGDSAYLFYTYLGEGNPLKLQLPSEPGQYELRYSLKDREIIHRRSIEVIPQEVDIIAPPSAPAGSEIEVGWKGPAASGDNIQIGPVGSSEYLFYTYINEGNPLRLQLPAQAGTYELRYRFLDRETIFTSPIEVTAQEVNIIAPEKVVVGSIIEIGWVGPGAGSDNIQIGPPGSSTYLSYTYVREGNPLKLKMPDQPGLYELRYSFQDRETIFTREIRVTPGP